jgi:hypothetical protein
MTSARLVRVEDQLRGEGPKWAFNPTTKLLETVAPLTWTGVRQYTIGDSSIRVLRRWSQVGSDGHKKTLKRLGATRQHPSGNRDVEPSNGKELIVGWTGDMITDEVIEGYHVPVAAVSVFEPETIAVMTREVDPLTQTSLGYTALWWSPDPNEIVSEGPKGVVGQWAGPNGPELYDCEHILDPACEIVMRLVRDADFDPHKLGANHFAIALERGRGGPQSELLRVVDSLDIPLGRNPVSVQVPKKDPADVEPARGVLDDDAAEPEAKPSATKTPACRNAISIYTPKRQARNAAMSETIIEQITLGIGRDNEAKLRKRGIAIPATHVVRVVDMDAEKIRGAIEGVQETLANVLVLLGETEEKMVDTEKDGGDKEALGAEIAAVKAKLAELEGQMAKAGDAVGAKTPAELVEAVAKTVTERDSLRLEVEPLRADAFARARDVAEKLGVDKVELDKATDLAAVRRLAVVHKRGATHFGKATDDMIAGAFMLLELDASVVPPVIPATDAAKPPGVFNMPQPELPKARDAAGTGAGTGTPPTTPTPVSTGASIKNNLRALG